MFARTAVYSCCARISPRQHPPRSRLVCLIPLRHIARSAVSFASAENAGAQITFRKVFKTSYPEFVEIKINQAGSGTYDIRQLDEDPNPQPFEVSAPLAAANFYPGRQAE